ncbi:hypothetical protein HYV44_03195 [Candidatus Microgenomates bacterium]|nr:hypothetical protein [Candidatus Microgenomates bacterium]
MKNKNINKPTYSACENIQIIFSRVNNKNNSGHLFLSKTRGAKEVIKIMAIAEKLRKSIYAVMAVGMLLGAFFAYSAPKVLAAPAYDYQLITQSPYPSTLAAGATTNVWIEVKNTGTATWSNTGANPVRLGAGSAYGSSAQQRDYSSEFAASNWASANRPVAILHPEIRSGWHTRFQFDIKAPTSAGTYKAYFTPVVDGVTWMKDIGIYWQLTVSGDNNNNNNNNNGGNTTVSDITVGVASDTPAASTVLKASTGVPVLKFNVQAPTTVTEIVVKRTGVGAAGDFDNVYLYDGATRLTNGRSVSSDTHMATFTNLGLDAATQRGLTLKADINASAGTSNQSAFEVYSVNGTVFTGKVGNTFTVGSSSISAATIAENGTAWNVTLGQSNVELGKFSLNASSATNDLKLNALTIRNAGTLSNSYIKSLVLKEGSNELATTASLAVDKAVFVLSTPYTLTKGQTKYFTVYGNLSGGRTNDTVIFYLDEKSDLNLTDSVFGFGINLTNSWASGDQTATATGGTITVANNGPVVKTYATNTTQNPFIDVNVSSERNITVKKALVKMYQYSTGTTYETLAAANFGYLKNIRIVDTDTGNTLVGPLAQASSGTCVEPVDDSTGNDDGVCDAAEPVYYQKEFTDQFDISAGTTKHLSVRADIDTSYTTSNRGIKLILDLSGTNYLYDNDSGQYVAAANIVPSSTSGNRMTVGSDSLTVALAGTPVSSTTVKNTQGVASVGYLFKSGDTNSSKVTKLVITGQGDLTTGSYTAAELDDVITSVDLYVDGVKVAGPVNVNTSGVATFNNLSISLSTSQSKKIEVYANVSSNATSDGGDDLYWLGIDAATDITVENGAGSSFSATASDGTWSANETNATPTVIITVQSAGTIVSSLDPSYATNANVVAGTSGVDTLRIKYTSAREAFTINKIRLMVDPDNGGVASADSASDNNIGSVVLSYKKSGGSEVALSNGTGYISGGVVTYTNLGIPVDKDSSTTVIAKVNYKTTAEGASSGEIVELIYDANSGFEAVGSGSGTTDTDSDTDVTTGGRFIVRKTVPTVNKNSSSPTSGIPGIGEVLRFDIAADAAEDLTVEYVTFKLTSTDNAGTSWNVNDDATGTIDTTAAWSLYKTTDLTTALTGTWSLHATDGSTLGGTETVGYARFLWTTADTVGKGTTTTYVLKVDTTGASSVAATRDSVRFDVIGTEDTTLTGAHLQWEDNSATNIDATNVKNLPVYGNTIQF